MRPGGEKRARHAYLRIVVGRRQAETPRKGCFAMPPGSNLSPDAAHYRARLGGLKSRGVPDNDPRYDEARRDLRAAVLTDYVERMLADWPPLTDEQRSKLAELLKPVRIHPPNDGGRVA